MRTAFAALVLILGGLIPTLAGATPRLVELAVFTCPFCKQLQSATASLDRNLGDQFIFAPVTLDPTRAYPDRVYYALRDDVDQRRLASDIFALMQDLRMAPKSTSDVLQWLQFKGLRFNEQKARKAVASPAVDAAMTRARRLAFKAGVTEVPAMVLVDHGQVIGTWTKEDNESSRAFVKRIQKAWEQYNGDK